jgi:hypothetical protein
LARSELRPHPVTAVPSAALVGRCERTVSFPLLTWYFLLTRFYL